MRLTQITSRPSLFHCIQVVTGEVPTDAITANDIHRGIELFYWFWAHTRRIYDMLDNNPLPQSTQKLLEIIQQKGDEISIRQLMRCSRQHSTASAAFTALQELVDEGKGECYYPPPTPRAASPPPCSD